MYHKITNRDEKGRVVKTHGMTNTRIYSIWAGIKNRCYNKKLEGYAKYGGNGILVCDEWKNDFMAFYEWSMKHGYADNLTIDRIDNKKGYSPDNCRWTDKRTQSINRTITRFIEVDGEKYTIPELAEKYGINKSCLYARAKKVGYNAKILEDVSVPKHFYKGKEYTLAELSRETGISSAALLYRIKAGWNADDLGNTPRKTGRM